MLTPATPLAAAIRRPAIPRSAIRPVVRRLVVAAAAGALLVSPLGTATPRAAAITPQPETTWERGVISGVADGDTVHVDITWAADPGFVAPPASLDPAIPSATSYCAERLNPDGSMPADGDLDGCRIRLIGIQAPEKAGASGGSALEQCKASAATSALKSALPVGTVVELRSISPRSVEQQYSGGRLARTVYARAASGEWVDVGRTVLSGGHAMWFPFNANDAEKPEYVHNLEYRRLVDGAAAAGRGLWSANYCGASTTPSALRVWIVSDPIGEDANNEHVVLYNDSDAALDVGGWTVRDSSLTWLVLPAGALIGPHDWIRIFAGAGAPGTPTSRDLHFGGAAQMFPNFDPAQGYFYGDSVAAHDVQPGYAYGNLRAWAQYPCDPAACTDPLSGRLRFGTISYDPPGADTAAGEYVDVVNVSSGAVSLAGYALTRQGAQFPFPPSAVVPAGGSLRVSVGAGPDDAGTVHMGRTESLLANGGDVLALANLNGTTLDCRAWGTASCAGMPVSGALQVPGTTTVSAPAPPPVAVAPVKATRPAAPGLSAAKAKSRRLVVKWSAPAPNGSAKVTKYRAKVHKKVGKKLKVKATCYASAKKRTCTTKKLPRRTTYLVVVAARNKKGYGPASAALRVRIR